VWIYFRKIKLSTEGNFAVFLFDLNCIRCCRMENRKLRCYVIHGIFLLSLWFWNDTQKWLVVYINIALINMHFVVDDIDAEFFSFHFRICFSTSSLILSISRNVLTYADVMDLYARTRHKFFKYLRCNYALACISWILITFSSISRIVRMPLQRWTADPTRLEVQNIRDNCGFAKVKSRSMIHRKQ